MARLHAGFARNPWRYRRTGACVRTVERSLTMQLLLDTHIWIWAVHSPEKLGHAVRRQLENPKNELFLSPVSIWEARHLVRRNRLHIKQSFPDWLEMVFARAPISAGVYLNSYNNIMAQELYRIDPKFQNAFTTAFRDRKSTRLNSSHLGISYAVFCLK